MQKGGIVERALRVALRAVSETPSPLPRVEVVQELTKLNDGNIQLGALDYQWGDLNSLQSLTLLCRLARSGYAPVFEFGTFRGRTTYNIALNLPAGEKIITLDAHYTDDSRSNLGNIRYPEYETGEIFLHADSGIREKITILRGDSTTLDLTKYYGQFGLVFVDGGHSYEVCLADSLTALKLSKTGGLILWDDYNEYWPGTKKAIDEVHEQHHALHYIVSHDVVMCKVGFGRSEKIGC
jgi:predicted O-methyltransferase YrrM